MRILQPENLKTDFTIGNEKYSSSICFYYKHWRELCDILLRDNAIINLADDIYIDKIFELHKVILEVPIWEGEVIINAPSKDKIINFIKNLKRKDVVITAA
jgi:hypothetical protein